MRSWIKTLGVAACLVGSATTAACNQSATEDEDAQTDEAAATEAQIQSAFDVNDVSILFPLREGVPYPQVRVSGIADPGQDQAPAAQQLWPKEVWEQVIAEAKTRGIQSGESGDADFFKLRGLWQIVGVRFDPCAPGFDQAVLDAQPGASRGKCIMQLRLIAQPFTGGSSADFSAHLVYNLGAVAKSELATNAIVKGAVKALGEIKDASSRVRSGATAGQPLGVHPGLRAESSGSSTAVADLVKTFIKNFTTTPSRAIAFMGLKNGGPEPWTFFAGRVESGRFVPEAGPVHGQRAQSLDFVSGNGPVTPKSTARASTTPLFDASSRDDLSAEQRKLAFAVEDPAATHFFNTDCVSCHTSSSRTHDLQLGNGPELARRTRVPKNLTGYVIKAESQDDAWNVRNFGYFFDKATVSGRTLTETVDVALWINKNVRVPGANLNGPGPDCTEVDDKVWTCFRDGNADCLTRCKPAPQPTPEVTEPEPSIIPIDPSVLGDPCVTATVGGAPTVEVASFGGARSLAAQISGNDSQCLSRVLAGAFVTPNLVMVCASPTSCTITMGDGATELDEVKIEGEELRRARQFLRMRPGTFFQSRSTGAGIRIDVGQDAIVVRVASESASLAARATQGTRINP